MSRFGLCLTGTRHTSMFFTRTSVAPRPGAVFATCLLPPSSRQRHTILPVMLNRVLSRPFFFKRSSPSDPPGKPSKGDAGQPSSVSEDRHHAVPPASASSTEVGNIVSRAARRVSMNFGVRGARSSSSRPQDETPRDSDPQVRVLSPLCLSPRLFNAPCSSSRAPALAPVDLSSSSHTTTPLSTRI